MRIYTNLFILYYFQSTFVELIMMLYRADASSKRRVNFKAQKNGFSLNIKSENVMNITIKVESEEKEEVEQKNDEKLNQKIKKRNQRKKKFMKDLNENLRKIAKIK